MPVVQKPIRAIRMNWRCKNYAEQDKLRGDWLSGAKSAWADYADSASDAYGQMKSFATSTFDGIGQNMADMLTTGKANWADFTRSTL
jgi:lambda family phage tail tape measure protein